MRFRPGELLMWLGSGTLMVTGRWGVALVCIFAGAVIAHLNGD